MAKTGHMHETQESAKKISAAVAPWGAPRVLVAADLAVHGTGMNLDQANCGERGLHGCFRHAAMG